MASKVQRQQAIGKLIGSHAVTNQPQLVELLADEGIAATQATVSRDLEDLGAVKVRVPGGETVYAIPEYEPARIAPEDQLRRVMGEWVAEVKVVGQPRRAAHAAGLRPRRRVGASTAPGMHGLLGTVAGDDTLLCVADEAIGGPALADHLRELAGLCRDRGTTPTGQDALARPLRGRPGRGADGLHREPAVRPAAVARRHRRLDRPRARAWRTSQIITDAERDVDPRRARPGRRTRWAPARSCSSPATRTSTPRRAAGHRARRPGRRQAAHRAQPQRPVGHRCAACG